MITKYFPQVLGSCKHIPYLLLAFFLISHAIPVFAQEQDPDLAAETENGSSGFEEVEGLENWSHELDVDELSPGIYNFVVEGTDKAGNKGYSDPINLYIDPESDKPIVGISNPEADMTVSGMLNIIGTAVDDDGVASVEVKINDGKYLMAEGKEFWSYYFDTTALTDGPCLLTVRSNDIYGVQGNEKSLVFVLDRSLPSNEILSHQNGDLVNGKIQIEGSSSDGNGLKKIEMSLDGESFEEISWKQGKNEPAASFKIALDTRTLEDGAQILWIRSTDKTGSEGLSSFLLFVDNNPPALDILYPGPEESLDGRFTVVGTALDEMGLSSLTYKTGKEEPIEIPLIAGDPYWSAAFDLSGEKKGDIRFFLTDQTGNGVERRLQLEFDPEPDRPVIELVSPVAEEVTPTPRFSGFLSDDDGVVEVVYSLDGEEPRRMDAVYSFTESLEGLAPGEHRLEYFAVDKYGRESEPVKLVFSTVIDAPVVGLDEIVPLEDGSVLAFEQALELEPETWKSLTGSASFPNGAGSVSWSLDGSEVKKATLKSDESGDKLFTIPLKDVVPGYHILVLSAVDRAGLSVEREFYFTITGAGGSRLRYADDRFNPSGKLKASDLVMEEKDRVTLFFEGDVPAEAEFSQDVSFLSLTIKDSRVLLESKGQGAVDDISISVTTQKGKEHKIGPFSVVADSRAPSLELNMARDSVIGPEGLILSGAAGDNAALEGLYLSVNGGSDIPLEIGEGLFEEPLDARGLPDGNVLLTFKARDRSGRTTELPYLLRKDTTPLSLTQLAPQKDRGTNGAVTFIGRVEDPDLLATVEFASDGYTFEPVGADSYITGLLDLTYSTEKEPTEEGRQEESADGEPTEENVEEADVPKSGPPLYRLTDKAGNVTLFEPDVLIDPQGDKPVVLIQIPGDDALIQDDFVVSGMAFDDDEVASLLYRLDGGDTAELSGVNSFELPLFIKELEENEHKLEIKAVDKNGVEGDWSEFSFRVSRREPASQMELPLIGVSVNGVVDITGFSEDFNGMENVFISIDNGNNYDEMETKVPPAEEGDAPVEGDRAPEGESPATRLNWSYAFNTNQLSDGNHSLLIKGVDRYGVTGLYTSLLTIDNTVPSLEIREPREGTAFTETLDLEGFLEDNGELGKAFVEIQSLSQSDILRREELSLDRLLRKTIDLSDFPEGWINMRFTAVDVTGNEVHISRNIQKVEQVLDRRVTLLTPSLGADVNGDVLVQGMVENVESIESVQLYLDGSLQDDINIKTSGFFSALLEKDKLTEGEHTLSVKVETGRGDSIESAPSHFHFKQTGPWISLSGFSAGDYATDRPWLTGTAGYDYIVPDLEDKERKAFEKSKAVERVEISLDNGKTFDEISGGEEWKFRLETQDMGSGELWLIFRARFNDGSSATAKTVLVVDKAPPEIELLTPDEGIRFDDLAFFTGIASDENGLDSVKASLREGNKNQYQVPAFIQGLFIDFHFLGSTNFEGGVGLTFFDDNVKLQLLGGMAPAGRFNGAVLGLKLLANVAALPWDFFLGYDFERFSSSFAVGTTFQYFSMGASSSEDASGIVLGAMLAQAELVKFSLPGRDLFSSFSFYTELQLWVISSDVDAGVEPRLAFGLRTDVF